MLSAIAHRGPDDESLHRAFGATLGSRRLAMIDVESGPRSMTNETGEIVATLNSEIHYFDDRAPG